ncbi:dTMP kinase [Photobacterium damselae]|uniref:dTMP kinase n=1 Tax=Photobacterium damselae TaxID=38293 RepID=UPI001EED541A|nr:dTMP kinase [Photobacterium damselae]UKA04515.1 dTMP kinase [Photobacterium damselae subsp. damselae]
MNNLKKGQFICVEGLEGAGKSSVMGTITELLKKYGCEVLETNEPCTSDEICSSIRMITKMNTDVPIVDMAECFLFYASRAQSVETIVKPALDRGVWVVSDRHDWTTIAYQSYGNGVGLGTLEQLRKLAIGDLKPDLTIYIDIDPTVGLERARGRGKLDRIEQKDLEFFKKARVGYKSLVEENPDTAVLIDGSLSRENVALAVEEAIVSHYGFAKSHL